MKRTDIVMTPYLENFLKFDLGHMNTDLYPGRVADVVYSDGLKLDLYYPEHINDKNPLVISIDYLFLLDHSWHWYFVIQKSIFL